MTTHADAIIDDGEGNILLQLRDNKPTIPWPNTLAIPGGRLNEKEKPIEAMNRILKEEFDVSFSNATKWKEFNLQKEFGQVVFRVVEPPLRGKTVKIKQGQKTVWVHYTKLDAQPWKYCAQDRMILDEYIKEFY